MRECRCVLRIKVDPAHEKVECLVIVFGMHGVEMGKRLKKEVVSTHVSGCLLLARSISALRTVGSMAATTFVGDLILKIKDILKIAIEFVRPKMASCLGVDQAVL